MSDIIEQCNKFLRRSSDRYAETIERMVNDLELYSGNFWSDTMKKRYRKGKNRVCLSLNNWNVLCNAIASPYSNSPWHIELENKDETGELQTIIDNIEISNDVKSALLDAFRKAVLVGAGYIVITTDKDENGNPKIVLESPSFLNCVALDPHINTIDGSDAEEGAIVTHISISKAKRLYGEDVIPFDYPVEQPLLSLVGLDQWNIPEDSVAVVSYYVKEEDGVGYYKICGDKVIDTQHLDIKYIPIIRLAGNTVYENGQINYNGIIQQTIALELGSNIAYSTLIERCGRSTKANFIANVDSIDGLEKYYARADQDDSMLILYKGATAPVPIQEQFQTGDLQNTIATTRTLMEDIVGVPLTGIAYNNPEKTATEVLRQQLSKESNTANYYNNAYTANISIAKIIIELLTGMDFNFKLENGPNVITRQMKTRQEIQALAGIIPENMKPVLAKYYADTLVNELGTSISRNIVANLPNDVKFITSDTTDPTAIHQMNQMRQTLDNTMNELDEANKMIADLQRQLQESQQALYEGREQRRLDWEKFKITEANKMELERAKLQSSNIIEATKLEQNNDKLTIEAEKNIVNAMKETNRNA